jgi:hypothetical protein
VLLLVTVLQCKTRRLAVAMMKIVKRTRASPNTICFLQCQRELDRVLLYLQYVPGT